MDELGVVLARQLRLGATEGVVTGNPPCRRAG